MPKIHIRVIRATEFDLTVDMSEQKYNELREVLEEEGEESMGERLIEWVEAYNIRGCDSILKASMEKV